MCSHVDNGRWKVKTLVPILSGFLVSLSDSLLYHPVCHVYDGEMILPFSSVHDSPSSILSGWSGRDVYDREELSRNGEERNIDRKTIEPPFPFISPLFFSLMLADWRMPRLFPNYSAIKLASHSSTKGREISRTLEKLKRSIWCIYASVYTDGKGRGEGGSVRSRHKKKGRESFNCEALVVCLIVAY